ncbi:hypothetical protein ACFMBG_15540 [Leisingera sp. D0M16]|uniref:hypothetical protein n=1 Tax=Leisingera coralii TaxID=3351347 RepID=UPI003B82C202
MGLLSDERYWAKVANDLWDLRPTQGATYSDEGVLRVLELVCKAMTDLVSDNSFQADLTAAFNRPLPSPNQMAMAGFLREFVRTERKIAIDSGAYQGAAIELGRAVRRINKEFSPQELLNVNVEELADLIEFTRKKACAAKKDLASALEKTDQRSILDRTLRATTGVVSISINSGVTAAATAVNAPAGAATGLLLGWSVLSGGKIVKEAWSGVW